MQNPFANIELKYWPDFLLAISGIAFVVSLTAMLAGSTNAKGLSLIFFGIVFFGIGGKIAHYRFRDPNVKGNSNAWFSGWRHSILADIFAGIGLVVILASIIISVKTWA